MTKSLDLKRDDPRSHPFDTTAPSISRRALDHADLLSGDYWGELRTFLWVAKAGSLSKAAELLGSSHATVGREIRRLQDQMGSQLVVLTKNGAQLTQKGHALTDELLRLDQRLFSIASDLRAEKAEAEGAVRLGITDGLGVCFLVPELRRFSKKYPKIQVHLKSPGNFKNLRENQTDVILGFSPDPSNDMTCRLGLGMSHEKLIALHRDVTEDDVAGPLENADVAIGRAEPRSLDFGKIAKPSKSRRADRLPFRINDEMRGLIVVAVDSLAHAQPGLLHEADRTDRDGVHELLRGGDHLDIDLVIRSHVVDAHRIPSRF